MASESAAGPQAILELRRKLFEGWPERLAGLGDAGDAHAVGALESGIEMEVMKYALWHRARQRGVEPPAAIASKVLVVIAEMGMGEDWALVFGSRDGAASLYTSTGGGVLGGEGHASVRAAANAFCDAGEKYVSDIPFSEAPPPGIADGLVRFSLSTRAGLRVVTLPDASLQDRDRPYFELFAGMHNLLAELRMMSSPRKERNDEAGFVNCLLTTLAQNAGSSASIHSDATLPDLAALTNEADQLKWIASHDFDYPKLNADLAIKTLLQLTSFGALSFMKSRGVLKARLATNAGRLEPVSFEVVRSKKGGNLSLVIQRTRS